MSKPKREPAWTGRTESPGDFDGPASWEIEKEVKAGQRVISVTIDNGKPDGIVSGRTADPAKLRDFARALDRAAAALEASSLENPDQWPPEGWKIGNPDWPSGKGPHLVPED